jgi:hypothetical protein
LNFSNLKEINLRNNKFWNKLAILNDEILPLDWIKEILKEKSSVSKFLDDFLEEDDFLGTPQKYKEKNIAA